jgi:serine/threonine-protein kinase
MGEKRLSFTFEKCLGMGGFGEVYVATMVQPGAPPRRVAVKVLKQDLKNTPEAVQRLRDEGRMLGVLDHPSIVRGLEMTLIAGRVALVTEYLEGLDLARATTPSTRLPPRVVLQAIAQVASALHTAFNTPSPETGKPLQLIHRDIKPDNLRIGTFGEVKVLDFGIARTTEMYRHAKTAQGALPFTPGYAPPEAFTKGFQGASSDIFALGVTLYRLITAQKFFDGMELTGQVSICCLPERYDPFLAQRLALVEHEGIRALLHDMLGYEPTARPTADVVEQRCLALAADLPGADLVPWARAMTFPPPKTYDGASLTGQTLEEDPLELATSRRINPREERKRQLARREGHPRDVAPRSTPPASLTPLPPPPPVEEAPTEPSRPADPLDATRGDPKETLDVLVAPPPVPTGLRASVTPAPVPTRPVAPPSSPPDPPKGSGWLLWGGIAAVVLILLGLGAALFGVLIVLFALL